MVVFPLAGKMTSPPCCSTPGPKAGSTRRAARSKPTWSGPAERRFGPRAGRPITCRMPTLSEAESKQLVARHGIPVTAEAVVASAEEAVAAAEGIGFPVVVKLWGPAVAHKTERGLVKLGLRDGAAVAAAAAELLAAARPEDGDVGLLVGEMVSGARELIAGFVRDDEFGPCVMLGIGGVLAEALGDVAFRLA